MLKELWGLMFIFMPAARRLIPLPVFNSDSPESECNAIYYSLATRPHLNWSPFDIKVPGELTLIQDCCLVFSPQLRHPLTGCTLLTDLFSFFLLYGTRC